MGHPIAETKTPQPAHHAYLLPVPVKNPAARRRRLIRTLRFAGAQTQTNVVFGKVPVSLRCVCVSLFSNRRTCFAMTTHRRRSNHDRTFFSWFATVSHFPRARWIAAT